MNAAPGQNSPGARPPLLPRRHKYKVLLALLLVSIAVQTYGVRSGGLGLASDIFITLLSLAIFLIVFRGARERAPAALILLTVMCFGWLRQFTGGAADGALALVFHAMSSFFMWVAVAVILRDLFRAPEAGNGNVLGAICGFLLAADAWTGINITAYMLFPYAYAIDPAIQAQVGHWHGRLAVFTYYSFSQITMLGYSDVTPVRAPATTLSLFAALFGMFYTAVVVSQFVSLAQGAPRDKP